MIIVLDFPLVELLDFLAFLMESQHLLLLQLPFGVLVFNVLLLALEIVDFCDQFLVLAHDAFIIGLMEFYIFLELLLEALDSGLKMGPFLDKFFLLVDALHLLFALFLDVLPVDLYYLRLQSFIVLNRKTVTLM